MKECDPGVLTGLLAEDIHANFHHLAQCHQDEVFNYLRYMLAHPQDAEDVLQNIFYKVYKAMSSFTDAQWATLQLKPWLFTIAHHEVINYVHRVYRQQSQSTSIEQRKAFFENAITSYAPSPEGEAEKQESQKELYVYIRRLSEPIRVVVVLHYILDLPYSEVAAILGQSENTVKSKGRRGFKALQQMMKEEVK